MHGGGLVTVTLLRDWKLPGCGVECYPRNHDPRAHELHGFLLATLTPPVRVVRTGGLTIDLETRRVMVDGKPIVTTPLEEVYLAYLAERLGRWCPARDVLRAVWGASSEYRVRALKKGGGYRYADTGMVTTFRNRLRKKLGPAARLIETMRTPHDGGSRSRLIDEEPT